MRVHLLIAFALCTTTLAGCFLNPYPPPFPLQTLLPAKAQDVEFLRGCWVTKAGPDGPITAFLRLLPGQPAGTAYQGQVQSVVVGELRNGILLSFARNGWSMTMESFAGGSMSPSDPYFGPPRSYSQIPDAAASRLPKVKYRATYNAYISPRPQWITAEGDGDTLAIYAVGEDGHRVTAIFNGARDGCD